MKQVIIIGAGYAGLTAALKLANCPGIKVTVVEKQGEIGGLSRTFSVDSLQFDIGPHIYFDKNPEINAFWKDLIGERLRSYTRQNKIFYQQKYINSPLEIRNALHVLGLFPVIRIGFSFLKAKLLPGKRIRSSKDWVEANFGAVLYQMFFKVYNEKIWGLSCDQVSSNWAGSRIKSSLLTMVWDSLRKKSTFVTKTFNFPGGGSKAVLNAMRKRLEDARNVRILLDTTFVEAKVVGDRVTSVVVDNSGLEKSLDCSELINTIALDDFVESLSPNSAVAGIGDIASSRLQYRHLVLVLLGIEKQSLSSFDEHWIDIHDPEILALRVTNFSNYNCGMDSEEAAPIALEYNVFESDGVWTAPDEEIVQMATNDLVKMGLLDQVSGLTAVRVVRLEKAYPVYFLGYEEIVQQLRSSIDGLSNVQTVGRRGMYKWNNMHHSVQTGWYAAENVLSGSKKKDPWEVQGMVAIGREYEVS